MQVVAVRHSQQHQLFPAVAWAMLHSWPTALHLVTACAVCQVSEVGTPNAHGNSEEPLQRHCCSIEGLGTCACQQRGGADVLCNAASLLQVAEGVATAGVVVKLARKYRVSLPVLTAVAQVLDNNLTPRQAVFEIMSLPQVEEH